MGHALRVVRGMIGTGFGFAVAIGAVTGIAGGIAWLTGGITVLELMQMTGKFSVVAFVLGVAFSGILAIAARGRQFSRLSMRLVAALGTGAGWLYFAFLAMNGGRTWAPRVALLNLVLLTVMGAGSAVAVLAIARRAGAALESGDELRGLSAGDEEVVPRRSRSKVEVPGA